MKDKRMEIVLFLTKYNKWRRGDNRIKQPNSKEIGEKLDLAILMLKNCITHENAALSAMLPENSESSSS